MLQLKRSTWLVKIRVDHPFGWRLGRKRLVSEAVTGLDREASLAPLAAFKGSHLSVGICTTQPTRLYGVYNQNSHVR